MDLSLEKAFCNGLIYHCKMGRRRLTINLDMPL